MKKLGFAAFLALCFSLAAPAFAGQQDFMLVNQTGDPIDQFFASPASSQNWEEDILGRDQLPDMDSVTITFARDTEACLWDFLAVYPDGEEVVWHDINLCNISTVILKWDEKNERTYAVVE
ncbi:hypothetical protein [Magnetofaba australis]|uniref:Argininosuccinate lyase n=1 Tax=Magnetofaba australis IT-1 TaxID=1434232 RepID=A0A1Y2K150_9PROT|nr:hypothetical protein [Magnetofaba australis]OSM01761.1 hypothetical protein MAIT1_01794 [Magnetofaba australis IT-1]